MVIRKIAGRSYVKGNPSPPRYYYNPRKDNRRPYVNLQKSKIFWKEELELQVNWQKEKLPILVLYGRFLFGFPHIQTLPRESEVTARSLIWLLTYRPQEGKVKGEFDAYVNPTKCFPGGFVDEDFWGLDYATEY